MTGSWFWRVVGIALLACLVLGEVTATANKETKNFDTDVRKILDIIIHSLYTNRGVFLRELVSNASDALDKVRFSYLTSPKDPKNDNGESPTLDIRIAVDRAARTITIRDGGCGMSRAELSQFLGTIGSSGTKKFLEAIASGKSQQDSMSLIGQFGVGFYSAYLVADNVRVASKSDDDPVQHVWESAADGQYSIYPDPRGNTLGRGTEITMDIKADADEFLEVARVRELAQKYSEFIHFPILFKETRTEKRPKAKPAEEAEKKEVEETDKGEDKDDDEDKDETPEEEEVTVDEWKQVNEQKPIWTRKPDDLKDEDYHSFYRTITKDTEDPLAYAHFSAEGEVDFRSLLFIPAKAPQQLFDGAQQVLTNIRLYVRRVFITDEFKDLLPRYLNFIKGVVDSDDLPLNVSRELLQESRIIKVIKKKLVRKVLALFKDLADEDAKHEAAVEQAKKDGTEAPAHREPKFIKLWEEFGRALRLGLIEDSQNRARLVKLLRYKSTKSVDKYITLEQYVDRMPEEQKDIYYIVGPGEDAARLAQSPALQGAVKRGLEVLLMTDAIDEYAVGHVTEFAGKRFVNMAKEDVKLPEKNEARQKRVKEARDKAWKDVTDWLRSTLGGQVERVAVSERLTDSPAVLVSPRYGMTQTMYRIIKSSPLGEQHTQPEPKKVLEINHRHPLVLSIRDKLRANGDDPAAKTSAQLLYDAAAVEGGFSVDSVPAFVSRVHVALGHMLGVVPDAPLSPEDDDTLVPPESDGDEGKDGADKEDEGASKVEVDEKSEAAKEESAAGEL